jgi:hypothetical protein
MDCRAAVRLATKIRAGASRLHTVTPKSILPKLIPCLCFVSLAGMAIALQWNFHSVAFAQASCTQQSPCNAGTCPSGGDPPICTRAHYRKADWQSLPDYRWRETLSRCHRCQSG